ncbi:MAG: RagB/SusD family nutrient uptake outer membrane protein [Prevotella sp.]|nr:RagB/SusD family nutrient uptake outer membrane protein [Prevotella sp.]
MTRIISKYKSACLALALGCSLALTTSCTDYLDKSPESDVSPEAAFKNFKNFQGFTEELYLCIPDFSKSYWTTCWNWGEDDIQAVGFDYLMGYKVDQGDFWGWQKEFDGWGACFMDQADTFDPNDRFKRGLWKAAWYGIRKANLGLENMDLMTAATQEEKNTIKGQLLFFRGWLHFQLMQYFGGLPYLDHSVAADQSMTLPRESCQACAEKAAKDFREAAELLPIDWDKSSVGRNTLGKNGFRINKITALAYEGKSLLWAASPLVKNSDDKMNVNGNASTYDYDTNYAQQAAEALGELLALVETGQTQYKLVDFADYSDLFYTWNKNMLPPGSTENILRDIPADAWQNSHFGVFTEFGGSILTGGKAASQPTANYVNYYGMKNGLPLDDPESGFDPTHPWKNRDPRFYHDIVYDGVKVVEGAIEPDANRYANLYTGGTYRDDINESRTGYLLYKFIPMIANNYDMGSTYNKLYIDVPYLRLADCYLMYAEACAAVGGATAKAKCSLTALDAVNKIRERAGVAGVAAKFTGNKDKFMDEVRRERAVELAFEGHRFNDLRRWLLLDKAPYNIKTSQEFVRAGEFDPKNPQNTEVSGFKEKTILTRHFTSKHWWMPLKKKDTSIYPEMFQNPGW